MNRVKVHLNLAVIIEGNFSEWRRGCTSTVPEGVEDWIMDSDPPALQVVCEDNFEIEGGVIYAEDVTSIEDLTDESEEAK